jgi:hypothetical protein
MEICKLSVFLCVHAYVAMCICDSANELLFLYMFFSDFSSLFGQGTVAHIVVKM